MRRLVILPALFAFALSVSAPAKADTLGECLLKSQSAEDQLVLMKWFVAAISLNDNITPLTSVTSQQRDDIDQAMAKIFDRLLFSDCHAQAVTALSTKNPAVFKASFEAFGREAVQNLFKDPKVMAGVSRFGTFLDRDHLAALMAEAQKSKSGGTN